MPGMRELKNHLRSVNTTGQLAGAMKTVSSAKFSRVNAVYAAYAKYAAACDDIISSFGEALADARILSVTALFPTSVPEHGKPSPVPSSALWKCMSGV